MSSVTKRIKQIKQPYGGYLKKSDFDIIQMDDGKELNDQENIHAVLVGMAVDYLTRLNMGASVQAAFSISLTASVFINELENAIQLAKNIRGLDHQSVKNACQLVGYDVCLRSSPAYYKPVSSIQPDSKTIENIIIMVERSLSFFKKYGPLIMNGFTFEGGYTSTITSGDGDYLTKDTLWDIKVSSAEPNSINRLQLMVYYLMGIHSIHSEFQSIKFLGIFNPRKNKIYKCEINKIPKKTMALIELEVIGYEWTQKEYERYILEASNLTEQKHDSTEIIVKDESNQIQLGDLVSHKVFGDGKVIELSPFNGKIVATVEFFLTENRSVYTECLKKIT